MRILLHQWFPVVSLKPATEPPPPQEHPYLNSNHLSFTTLSRFKKPVSYNTQFRCLLWCSKGHCYLSATATPRCVFLPQTPPHGRVVFDPFQTPGRSSKVTTECFVGGFMFYALFEASLVHSLQKSKRSENKYDSWPLKCK